jgi:hypothetical protein
MRYGFGVGSRDFFVAWATVFRHSLVFAKFRLALSLRGRRLPRDALEERLKASPDLARHYIKAIVERDTQAMERSLA